MFAALPLVAASSLFLAVPAPKDGPKPSTNLSPEQVVRFQIEAYEQNDLPEKDAGVKVAFRFTSDVHRKVYGSVEEYTQMLQRPAFKAMFQHDLVVFGEVEIRGHRAMQAVVLITEDGESAGYVFMLSRQKGGPNDGCWLTDGVIPISEENDVIPSDKSSFKI